MLESCDGQGGDQGTRTQGETLSWGRRSGLGGLVLTWEEEGDTCPEHSSWTLGPWETCWDPGDHPDTPETRSQ